jgi:hypothetical protein
MDSTRRSPCSAKRVCLLSGISAEEQRCLDEMEKARRDAEHFPDGGIMGLFDWFEELMLIRGELSGFKPRKD